MLPAYVDDEDVFEKLTGYLSALGPPIGYDRNVLTDSAILLYSSVGAEGRNPENTESEDGRIDDVEKLDGDIEEDPEYEEEPVYEEGKLESAE